jgi:hypothetical protein
MSIKYYNNTKAPNPINAIKIVGPDSLAFTILSPLTFPVYLAAYDSLEIVIRFKPVFGERHCHAECITYSGSGAAITEVRSSLTGIGTSANLIADVPLLADTVSVGSTPALLRIHFVNKGPLPVSVESVTTSAQDFTIVSMSPQPPCVIDSNQSIEVTISFSPSREGLLSDNVLIQLSKPCDVRAAYLITGTGVFPGITSVALMVPVLSGSLDDRILVPIQASPDLSTTGSTSWAGSIRFNRTMLYPWRVIKENTISANMKVNMSYDHKTGTLALAGSGAALKQGPGPLAYVEMQVLLGDALQTSIEIEPGFDFTSGRAHVTSRVNGEFNLTGYCMGQGNRLVQITGSYALKQNHPNPFNPATVIEYDIAMDANTELTIFDAWGRTVAVLANGVQTAGRHTVSFDASRLSSGTYYYRLVSGRFMDVKRMVVSK